MDYIIEMLYATGVNPVNSLFKLLLGLVLGALVGLERRQKGQIAGMRTFALICMGATLAMIVSIYIPEEYLGLKNGDPGRIAAQVISGIGFLGAGAIIQSKGSVRGLTTAAGIWMTACLGLAVGAGMYLVAVIAGVLVLIVLRLFELWEKRLLKNAEQKIVRLKLDCIVRDAGKYRDVFRKYHVHISDELVRYDYTAGVTTFNFMVRSSDDTDFVGLFGRIHEMGGVLSLTLANEVNN